MKNVSTIRAIALAGLLPVSLVACGDDAPAPKGLTIYPTGWPSGTDEFPFPFPETVYDDVFDVRILGYTGSKRVFEKTVEYVPGLAPSLPTFKEGKDNWIVLQALNEDGDVIASGASARLNLGKASLGDIGIFTMTPYAMTPIFDIQGLPSRMQDSRAGATFNEIPGNAGYVVVGGAQMRSSGGLGGTPIAAIRRNVEIFNPLTHQFEEALDENGDPVELGQGRAFHTATWIDGTQLLIWGGVQASGGVVQTTGLDPELLVWNPKTRTFRSEEFDIGDADEEARAFHTAHALPSGGAVIIGGVSGSAATPDAWQFRKTIIVVDRTGYATLADGELGAGRSHHASTLVDNAGFTEILVSGGRTKDAVLKSTEVLFFEDGTFFADPGPDMAAARFGHGSAVTRANDNGAELRAIAVVGGYSQLPTSPSWFAGQSTVKAVQGALISDGYAFSDLGTNAEGRAFFTLVPLTLSRELVAIGGLGDSGAALNSAEQLRFELDRDGFVDGLKWDTLQAPGGGRAFSFGGQLASGLVLSVGGYNGTDTVDGGNLYNPDDFFFLDVPLPGLEDL